MSFTLSGRTKTGIALFLVFMLITGEIAYLHWRRIPARDDQPQIESYFSPNGGIKDRIIREIGESKATIDVAVYTFTEGEISYALLKAKERGVKIRIVMDRARVDDKNSKYYFFQGNNFEIRLVSPSMHNKYAIFDGKTLITGSYNWTGAAEKTNFENVLFVQNAPNVIAAYQDNFERLWKIGQ